MSEKKEQMKRIGLVAAGAFCVFAAFGDFVDYVDPFVGTAGTGHTFPAACVPFGLVQAGPDTGSDDWDHCSGYNVGDRTIYGFSQTHLNGTGGEALGDILIAPFTDGPVEKGKETAAAGFYSVEFPDKGLCAEATASEHVGFYRFSACDKLLVDCQWGIAHNGRFVTNVLSQSASLEPDGLFTGERETSTWNYRKMAFALATSRPIIRVERLPQCHPKEKGRRYVLHFGDGDKPTLVKVSMSASGDVARARRNLAAEIPGWDFDAVKNAARQKWNEVLGAAVVEGSDEQKKNWYTSLYHLCIQPNNIADVGEKPFYSTFSCWDTFRAAGPLYTILYPEKAAEFVDSMLEQGRRTGYLPIWTLWGKDNQCMIGTHSVPMIVDWFLKEQVKVEGEGEQRKNNSTVGLRVSTSTNYWESAYQQIKETLTKKHEGRIKENWDLYDQYGYYPFDKIRGESVSRTMECAYDDWCAGVMAEKLGHKEDATFFFKRSAYWKNVFDPSLGLVRGKDTKGKWREPFDPYALGHGADLDNDFTEGNAFQYSWHVMQDVPGLVAAMGGRETFVKKLDALFEAPPKTEGMGCLVDITGLIGQYVHGNEPSHHVVYFYPQVGHPEKAAERIREVFDKFYLPKPDGLCGNDDCGQMSAWYLFSAMGFYPFNPCGGEYIIGAPQLPQVTLRVPCGKLKREVEVEERMEKFHSSTSTLNFNSFTLIAKGLSKENKYVKSVTLNGKPIADWKIRHEDIVKGGELVFEMNNKGGMK